MSQSREMKLVSNRLSMPLFVLARNRIMEYSLNDMRRYLHKKRRFFTMHCKEDNATENVTKLYLKHIAGFYKHVSRPYSCPYTRSAKYSRDLSQSMAWNMAPNRYTIPVTIGASRKGQSGAYWRKEPKLTFISPYAAKPINPKPIYHYRFYDVPYFLDRWGKTCYKHKGIFLHNARERRPTLRCMVSNLVTCFRNPKEPGPTTHYSHLHEFNYNKKQLFSERPNPHLFDRLSIVPTKPYRLIARHTSFRPGPGRYEIRFRSICPCSGKLIYMPDLQLAIDREKRFKFRRMPYTKIKARLYCSPDLRHVIGHGHRHLFKNIPKRKLTLKTSMQAKKSGTDKMLQLYPTGKYIALITSGPHKKISFRKKRLAAVKQRIKYNSVVKHIKRRQLRNNKKIVFNSGCERFKNQDHPLPLTVTELERIKARLPPERVLIDHPVMQCSPADITSKLTFTPLHQLCNYELQLRKKLFKFPPLPIGKVLVTEEAIRGQSVDGVYEKTNFYKKPIDEKKFFKDLVQIQ